MSFSIDVSANNFQKDVLDQSNIVPIVVDFWAPWCGPCRALKPLLEKLAEEFQGKFILAKINADENQALAGQFGVRGIPSVKAIYQGKIVDEFSGALPEPQVRQFIQRILPSKIETLIQQVQTLIEAGELEKVKSVLQQAKSLEPDHSQLLVAQLSIALASKDIAQAREIVQRLPINISTDEKVKKLITQLELLENSADLPPEDELQSKIKQDQNDLQSRLDLANLCIVRQDYPPAFEQLFEIIKRDRTFQDDVGRKTMLNLFTLLGNRHELVRDARRQLSKLLN